MNEKIIKIFTAIANRLNFYLEAIHFMTPIRALTSEQLRGTNDHGSKKRNR